jgi:Zn-dependent protease with chaperone function
MQKTKLYTTALGLPLLLLVASLIEILNGSGASRSSFAPLIATMTNVATICAALSLLMSALLIIKAHNWQKISRDSREGLLQSFAQSQRQVPKILTAMLLLFSCGVFLLGASVALEIWQASHSTGSGKLIAFILITAGAALYASIKAAYKVNRAFAHEPQPFEVTGQQLTATQAPALWQNITQIAQQLGAPVPQNLIIGAEDGFYVTESSIALQPSNSTLHGQTLYLSATRMLLMSSDEIRSIIGHELGHFAGDDTAYSQRFSPLYAQAIRNHYILGEELTGEWSDYLGSKLPFLLNEHVLDHFHYAIQHWSRIREFAADQSGKAVSGGLLAASALLRYGATTPVLAQHQHAMLNPNANALQSLLSSTTSLEDTKNSDEQVISHPTDSHPPTLERVGALAGDQLEQAHAHAMRPINDEGAQWLGSMIPNFHELFEQLSGQIAQATQSEHAQFVEHLTSIETQSAQPVEIIEDMRVAKVFAWILIAAFIISFLAIAATFSSSSIYASLDIGKLTALFFCITAALWYLRLNKQRTQAPFIRLTPEGIESQSFGAQLLWSQIDTYQSQTPQSPIFLTLNSGAGFSLKDTNFGRLSHNQAKNIVTLGAKFLKGMYKTAAGVDFYTAFEQSLRAHYARKELQRLRELDSTVQAAQTSQAPQN